ncbi:MAG: hypothetical protein JHC26_05555, partial [Thermofilum sp.]|uniref:hypothetical protein n=1 Tax=Thermofilum sp. TaxID=1961369 RepID=UPI00258F4590
EKGEKPITIRGEKTILSIFVSENKITFSVSKRTENGFEKIDRYTIPVSWLMSELFRKNTKIFADWCEILNAIEENSE